MSGTPNGLAVRDGWVPAQHDAAALALIPGQTMWTRDQHAALVAMGIPPKASSAELGVFLHTCQRLRLDPFLRQIYLIYRKAFEDGRWVEKPTTQIGIDGFRVTRDRICAERGLLVEYDDTVWFDGKSGRHEVWLLDTPPAACKFVVRVDGRRFPATLNFNEYCQRKKDGELNSMWATKSSHQIEKCAEAEGLRKAFPNDLSGVILTDAAPLDDPDAPDRMPGDRPRVTAAQARNRTVTAAVVTQEPSPAAPEATPSGPAVPPSEVAAAGEATHLKTGPEYVADRLEKLGVTGTVRTAGRLAGRQLASLDDLTDAEAVMVMRTLSTCTTPADLDGVLAEMEMASDSRDDEALQRGEDGTGA